MKTIKKALAALVMSASLPCLALTETVDGITWTYTVANGYASVGGGSSSSTAVPQSTTGAITIPSKLGGKPVTRIGHDAFYYCSGLTSVTIPNSVTSIGYDAFYYCSGLTSVTIPNSVTSIGSCAFYYCSGLTSVTIGNGVTSIGASAFSGCSALTSVTIPDSVTSIEVGAFSGCSGLTSVTIPDSVASIGNQAFRDCYGLTSVTIPDGVTVIGNYAFMNCSGLTSVTIPDSVTSIGGSAFSGCSGLTSVTVPGSVTNIGSSVFSGCSHLTEISVGMTNPMYKSVNGLLLSKDGQTLISGINGNVTIPDGITSIGSYAFSGCSGLTHVTIPDSVTSIGGSAFSGCNGLTHVTIPGSVTNIGSYVFFGCSHLTEISVGMTNPMYKSVNGLLLSKDGQTLISGINGNVTIPDGITSIGSYAFSNCSGLTSVTIPDSVTSIGSYAFSGCSGLTSVTIPDSVTSIGYDAFEDCSGLTSVTIGNSVTNIGSFAFYGCSGLTDVTIPDGVTNIGYSAFYDTPFYNNKPDGLVIFGTIVYKMKGSFPTTVTIPNGVTSIGMYAFSSSGCSVMTSVIIPDSVMRIEECAFEGCRGLTNVTIGTGVMSIGLRAFFHCSGLTSVTIPDSVTSIGSWAFSGCSGLASVTIPSNVDNIYAYAFDGCENLNSIFVPRGCSVDVRAIPSATTVYRYTPIQTILFDRAGGVAEIDSITVKWGEPYGVLPIPNRTGYSFNGWKCGDMVVTQDTIVTVLDDHTLVAQWTPNKYTVIFSANGGTGGMIGSLDYGSALVAPTVTRTGYTFKGWSPNVPATVPLGGATYTALWTPNKYIVTFNANGGTGGTSREMDYESALVAPTVTRTDYTFKGWSPSVPATVPLGGATYTAQWQLNQYTVTFDANGGEGGTSRVFAHGASLTLPTVTRRSHEFVGWFTAADGGTQIAEGAVVVGDMVLYAHWEQQPTVLLYEVSDGKATITKYSSPACEIVVPLEIDGYPVVGIGAGAFANCTELTSVTIPNSVTNIGAAAFSGCSGLTEITLPFVGSQRGTSGSPDSLFGYIFGTSSYTGGTGVRQYVTSSLLASYYIPSSLRCVTLTDETLLGYGAFSSCSGLTNVVINGSMNSIGERAFLNCIGLVSVKIPDTVTDIGTNAFRHCTELVSISMGNRVERIHNAAFQECRNLVNVTLPDSVQSLGPTAFSYCSSLTDMVLSNVTNIAFNAFYECTELKRVEFHACLNAIGSAVFYNCTNLTALTFYDDAPKIVRGNLFNGTAPDGSCAYVRRNSTGWNVPIPGTWNGIAIDYIHHTVTLDSNGGTCATGELSIADGDMVGSLPIPRKEGHGFLGWFTAANGGDKLDETMVVDEDVILYAHWGSLTIEEALGVGEGVTVTTDENFPWLPIFDLSAKLGDAMARSGGIGNRTNTWLSATVEGAGTMAFWCKTSCEHDEDDTFTWDRLMVYTNDVEIVDWRMDGETGWTERTLSFDGGVNTVKWVYYKDKNGTEGEDCAWVDGVTWTPSGSADVVVPVNGTNVTVSGTWLAEKTARAATDDAANGRKVWQCYMLGLDPEQADDDFRITRFWMDGDKPMFEFSHTADGSGNTFVPRIRKMGSATPTGPWQEVPATGNPAYRFFKAEVALP